MRFATITLSIVILVSSALIAARLHPATASQGYYAAGPDVALSHFLCYVPSPQGSPPPAPRNVVNLTDQFQSFQTQLGPVALFCNPVMKQLQPGVSPLPVPAPIDHLTCYMLQGPSVTHLVEAENQLARPKLNLTSPTLLCVPTHKKVLH